MADTGIKFDFKPLQQYSERLDQLDKYAKNLDKTLDGLQARQSILDKRFEEGSRTTQRMVDAFNKEDRAAIAALRSSEKLEEVFSKAPSSVKRFEDSLNRTKQALEDVKAASEKVDASKIVDEFETAGTKSAEGFGGKFKAAFSSFNLSGAARSIGTKLQDGLRNVLPDVLRRSGDILAKGFTGIAQQVGRSFLGGLQSLGNGVVGFFQGVKDKVASAFQGIGQALSIGGLVGGLSIGAIAGASFDTALEFDRAIINTQAATQQTNEEIAILREQLLEIGGNSRVGVEATANAFYDVASAVSDVNLQLPILESSILLAESGSDPVNELATATDGLVNVFNAYGLTADQATRVSDTFSRSVQLGKGSLTEFVDAISSVAVVGANANVSFEELGASIAFITARGASASEAATQLERATSALLRPNADLQVLLGQIGFESGSAALETLGLAGTLQALYEATGGNVDQFAQALGSVEAFQAGLALADEGFNEFQNTFNEGLDGATLRSAEIQANSIAAQFDELNASLGRVQVILADAILPAILPVVQGFTDFLQTIAQNNPEVLQFAAILGVVAIALPAIAAAFTLILNPVTLLVAAVIALSSAFVDFSQSIPLLQEAAGLVQDIGSALGLEPDVPTDAPTPQKPTDTLQNTAIASREEARLAAQTRTRLGTEQQIADVREESAQQTLDYTVEAGDTLSQVAADYGVSIEDLLAANPEIENPNLIFAGQTLTIPSELSLEVDTSSVEDSLKSAKDSVDTLVSNGNPFSDVLNVGVIDEMRIRNIRGAIDDLKASLVEIFDTTRLEIGEGFSNLLGGLQDIASGDVSGGLVRVKDAVAEIIGTVLSAGEDFGFAIIDFLGEVFGIDTEAARQALTNIITPIRNLIDGLQGATTDEFSQFGTGIETIISASESLLDGDIGGALSGLGSGIADIAGGLVGLGFETFDQFLIFIEDVTGIDTSALQTAADNVRSVIDGLIETIESFASPVLTAGGETIENVLLPALSTLGTGLSTFIGQVGDLLQGDSVQRIATFFGQIFGLGVVFFGSLGGSILESLGENLPLLGQGITDIVDAVAAFLSGDVGGGLTLLATGLGNIYNAIISFGQDTTIGLLQAIQDITGLDTTGLQQVARDIEIILKNPLIAVQEFILGLGEDIERFVLWLQTTLIEALLSIPGLDQLGIDVEQLQVRLTELQSVQLDIEAASGIEDAIASQLLPDGVIDLGDFSPLVLFEMQNADVTARIGPATLANLRDAVQDSLVAGTAEDALSNLTVASAFGIDISDQNFIISDERKAELSQLVASQIESIISTAPEDLTPEQLIQLDSLIDVAGELNLDLGDLDLTTAIEDFQTELDASLASGDVALSVQDFFSVSDIDFTQAVADMNVQGGFVAQGFADGISGSGSLGADAASDLGEQAVESTANAVGSHSPATEFIAIGQFITEGLAIGIRNGFPAVSAINGLLKNEMRSLGAEGASNINALSNAYQRFAGVVQGASTKIIQALNAVKDALINFGTAAAGLALSVSVAENAVAGTGPDGNYTGGIVTLETGGVVQTLSNTGMSEHALYRAGSALSAIDHSAAYALVGERGREIATYDTSLFSLNNNLSRAYDFGYQQALRPTANISFVGTRGPELIRTRQSLAILNNQTTEAYLNGYRSAFQGGYQRGGVIHTEIPRMASGGVLSPAVFASLSGMGGTIINEDNSMDITIIVEGGSNAGADDVADSVQERMEDLLELRARQKKLRITRKM
jgi:TP901 family phage tail tape measure protein